MAVMLWMGQVLVRNGSVAIDPACCCGEGPTTCCDPEPAGNLTITFASECDDVDGHAMTLYRTVDGWIYNHFDHGDDPVFQDIHIELICRVGVGYLLSIRSGCLADSPFELLAETTECSPFRLTWSGIGTGILTTECFGCVPPGGQFTYNVTITE